MSALLSPLSLQAADIRRSGEDTFIIQQQRQEALEQQLTPSAPDVRLSAPGSFAHKINFPVETPCFQIKQTKLKGADALPHWLPLQKIANGAVGHCLGAKGINLLMSTLQNRLVDHGYVTTRVLAPSQDLKSGILRLVIIPGVVRHVRLTPDSDDYIQLYSSFPAHEGSLLDLRDIEQGLENMQRLPGVQADMEIVPGEQPGESDILITRKQDKYWRLGFSLDDSGISVSASANQGKGSEKGNGTTHTETTVDAGKQLTIISGRDTTLTGAQAGGETVKVDAGRHLTLTSEQDSDRYDSKQQNASAGGSFTFGSMSGSASVNLSRDKMHSNYDSVQEQTGIFAGRGGFDVTTGQHTQLNGAVIASTATADKNRLDTGTLGFSDIENRADFKTEHQSAGLSTGGSVAGNFLGNMANNLLVGANHEGHADSTTQSAVSAGNITIRDTQSQKQDVADLKRDAAHANQTLSPIFDREKEQQRLQQAQLIGEIGNQVADIARTEGQIAGEKAKRDPAALNQARAELEAAGKPFTEQDVAQRAYNNGMAASGFGTGGKYQQAIQAATAAVQGLAGGNLSAALAGGAVPYIAEIIKQTTPDGAGRVAAHAVVNAALSLAQGKNALAGAAGAATGEVVGMIATQMYGKPVSELSETEKQTVSTLATVAAGLAGGLVGDSGASAVAGAQSGKTTVENNFLGTTSSDKLDKAVEKIKNGDKSLATANELIRLENADKRSDALVSKFTKDPSQMTSTERAELAAYLRVYASEMEKEYGTAVAQELVTGLLSGQDYIKRNPDTEAMAKAQSIMNTWGYHKSNASIGDAPLLFGGSVLGLTVKGMATNAAIGISVNSAAQLAGKDPFSYVDAIMAGVTAAATTGKGIIVSTPINMGGAAIGSSIKGEDPTNSVIGAGVGSIFGGGIGKIATEQLKPVIKEGSAEVIGAVTGAVSGEVTGNQVKDKLDKVGNKNGSN
ncbi:TPA: hemagglutinin repeat-containing protein [Escherichia coli]|nr:hemagglutinin [Escherichia coli]EYD91085.1 hemagluttinin repeat family protein [Escherichia coli 1-176-05_S1_C1]EZK24816.1 hemagluttinin repeat family protein [Escherichia coli 1-176-05_S1_C2]EFG4131292.1 hemagglutinin [Escherichia coli]EFL6492648.1 hemagglutinin [Escherichia coli]